MVRQLLIATKWCYPNRRPHHMAGNAEPIFERINTHFSHFSRFLIAHAHAAPHALPEGVHQFIEAYRITFQALLLVLRCYCPKYTWSYIRQNSGNPTVQNKWEGGS